jgi:hypothetical protein
MIIQKLKPQSTSFKQACEVRIWLPHQTVYVKFKGIVAEY